MLLELIARLNAKSTNFLSTGGGGGGNGSLTNEDIAGALAGVKHPLGSILLRTMIAGQDKGDMYREWAKHVVLLGAKAGWKSRQPQTITRLAFSTLDEHLDCRCKSCLGRGTKRKRVGKDIAPTSEQCFEGGYLVVQCEVCQGTGKGAQTDSMRGRLLGMNPNSFTETWATRYESLLLELSHIQRNSEDDFKRQFKR